MGPIIQGSAPLKMRDRKVVPNICNKLLNCIEERNYRLSRNVGEIYQFTLRNVLEEPRSQVHRSGRLKSRKEQTFSPEEINCSASPFSVSISIE